MYYIVFYMLLCFSIIEVFSHKIPKQWFTIVYLLMTFMVMFRYGQLTDYFNYADIYEDPDVAGISDPLYFAITDFLRRIGVSYTLFIMITGFVMMATAYPYFYKHCQTRFVPLFVFYCYAFLILPMNAMRQGICLCVLLGSFGLLLNNRRLSYCLLAIVGTFFHYSMIVVILIVYLYKKKFFNEWFISWIVIGFTLFALVVPDLSVYMPEFLSDKFGVQTGESKYLQFVIRACLVFPLLIIHPPYGTTGYYAKAICIVGYCLYCFLSFHSLIAARIEYYFRIYLCLFVSFVYYMEKRTFLKRIVLFMMIMVHVVLFYKNMDAAIEQGDYNTNKVSLFNFPYISIFDDEETLNNYK